MVGQGSLMERGSVSKDTNTKESKIKRHHYDATFYLSTLIIILCTWAIVWHFVSGEQIRNNEESIIEANQRIKKIETHLNKGLPQVLEEVKKLRQDIQKWSTQ